LDCSGRIAVIHNGIIENYSALRASLHAAGHRFASDTDTEVVAHLIEDNYSGDLAAAVRAVLGKVHGAYALGVLSADSPGEFVFAGRGASPLVGGPGNGEPFGASDTPAIMEYTRKQLIIHEGEVVVVTRDGAEISTFAGDPVEREITRISWDVRAAEKGGFKHFMLKEIYEQPKAVRDTLAGRIREDGTVDLSELGLTPEQVTGVRKVSMFA